MRMRADGLVPDDGVAFLDADDDRFFRATRPPGR